MQLSKAHIKCFGWILSLKLLLIYSPAFTQSPGSPPINFEQYGEESGINRYISCIFEDNLGYLWFGAGPEGLYRYNGYEFEHYEYIVGDSTSLPHNIVAKIFHEDHAGNLWLASGGAITRYNRASNDFSRNTWLKNALDWNTWASINSLVEDAEGNIWLGSYGNPSIPYSGGLIRIDPNDQQITRYRHDPEDSSSLSSNCVSSLSLDQEGRLWVGSCGQGIHCFVPASDGQRESFIHFRHVSGDPDDRISTTIRTIADDGAGSLWFTTEWRGVLQYIKEKDRLLRHHLPDYRQANNNRITDLSIDKEGGVWLATGRGLARFDPDAGSFKFLRSAPPDLVRAIDFGENGSVWLLNETADGINYISNLEPWSGKFREFRYSKVDPQSISSNKLNSIMTDRTGTLWIATAGGGICKYDPAKLKFSSLYTGQSPHKDVYPERILALCVDHSNLLWIGTEGEGLYVYDRRSGATRHFSSGADGQAAPKSRTINSIIEYPEGILWIGGDSGLTCLDTRRMEFDQYWPDPDRQRYFGPNFIRDLYPDASGNIWIATMHGGLFSFKPATRKFSFHGKSELNPGGVPATGLMTVYVDKGGTVWTGSLGGLFRYTPANPEHPSSHIRYHHDPDIYGSISADMVGDIIPGSPGTLWVATGGGGLNKLDIASGEFTYYTTRDGLLSNSITNLLMDRSGKLWLGSFSGLGMFDPESESCTVFERSDGLASREIQQGSACVSPGGEFYFAGPDGINYFHPDSLKLNKNIPPVVISKTLLFEAPLKAEMKDVLELNHDENFLTFEFAALSFTNSHKNQYCYRMIGMDPDTVFSGTRRMASYTDMKPGKYTFWVSGSNNDGIWNRAGTSMDIIIHPPWSGSKMAIGLYIILLISGVLGIIRLRTWKLLNDRKILEHRVNERIQEIEERDQRILEMDRMKTRFFTNISHEIRTPLSLIISPLEDIIKHKKQDDPELKKLEVIRRNSKRLLSLTNQLLDLSKLDSGNLKLELTEADVIHRLSLSCASFISLAEKNRIRYNYRLPDEGYVTYFDVGKTETILINLISNAFKFTPMEGAIDCHIKIEDAKAGSNGNPVPVRLSISIMDSGAGISLEEQQYIFDRFYQGEDAHLSETEGTGIGLSLTKELVELLHGEISLNSKPGRGSCFQVSIPLGIVHLKKSEFIIKNEEIHEARQSFSLAQTHVTGTDPGSKESISLLIVEDHADLRSYLAEQLQSKYKVMEAKNGEEGLSLAIKHIPDLIITDVMMPGMGGMDLCHRIKTNEKTSHIPVVILTAKADFESKIRGLKTGADEYILKPFQIQEIQTRVENLIRQRSLLRERFSPGIENIADEITLNSHDIKFLRRVTEVVEDHLSDMEFSVYSLQEKSGFSQAQLYRKLHALTGLSPSRFIRLLRLKRAVSLLEQNKGSVTQVALEVGFGNLSYFTKCFKEQFGLSPSQFSSQYK